MTLRNRLVSLLLVVTMLTALFPVAAQAASFRDTKGHWAEADIDQAVDLGLFTGTSDTAFSPNAPMTRAMFVTVLHRADDGWYDEDPVFTDVRADAWYYDAVCWASEHGLVTGTDARHFSPNENVTREQMVAILYRYLDYADATLAPTTNVRPLFYDRDKISAYARAGVEAMQYAQIIRGKPAHAGGFNFDPQGKATRAEAARVFCLFFDQIQYEEVEDPETPEAVLNKLEEVMESEELAEISQAYNKASESGKKECVEQTIDYFETLEEFGEIDNLTVDRTNRSLSYEIDGVQCAYLLYNMREELTGTGGVPVVETPRSAGTLTGSAVGATPGTLVGAVTATAAQQSPYKALVLESYAYNATGEQESDFHYRSTYYHDQLENMGKNCVVNADTHYNITVDSLKQGLNDYDIIMVNSHGGYADGEPFIALEEKVTPSKHWNEYYTDCLMGRTLVYGVLGIPYVSWFGVRGEFFEYYYDWTQPLKAKWVHLGICFGMQNNALADGLIAAGADTVTGYTGEVALLFDEWCIYAMWVKLKDASTLQQAVTYADPYAREQTNDAVENVIKHRPKLVLRGSQNTQLAQIVGTGKIAVQLQPDQGTVSKGSIHTYKLEGTKEISVDGDTQFTGSSFVIGELEEGARYKVKINADGYFLATLTATASKNPTTQTVQLTKQIIDLTPPTLSRTVTVSVKDGSTDKAIPGAALILFGRASSSDSYTMLMSGTADSSGQWGTSVLSKYTQLKASASKSGYVSGSTEITSGTSIEVTLYPEPDLTPDPEPGHRPDVPAGYTPIYTAEEFDALSGHEKVILMNDLKFTGEQGFKHTWSGVLDGNGHTISGIKAVWYYALSGWIVQNTGTIKNVHFQIDLKGNESSLYAIIGCNEIKSTIENCVVTGSISVSKTSGSGNSSYVGQFGAAGLVAQNKGIIRNCVNRASVSATTTGATGSYTGSATVGGIAARNTGEITNCLNLGNISVTTKNNAYVGGIAGDGGSYSGGVYETGTVTGCGNGGSINVIFTNEIAGVTHGWQHPIYRWETTDCYATSREVKDFGDRIYIYEDSKITVKTRTELENMWSAYLP